LVVAGVGKLLIVHILSMSRPERIFTGLLVAALAGASWVYHRAQARQAATLARLAALETCLTASNQQRAKVASHSFSGIKLSVTRNHNQASDRWVLRQAQRIQLNTQLLTDTLRQLQQHWPATGNAVALARLSVRVRQYVDSLEVFETGNYLANSTEAEQTKKRLRKLDWEQVPASAVPTALVRLEAQVRQVAADALDKQAVKVGSGCGFCFERIGAYAVPMAEVVAPGELYEARLMLSASAPNLRPTMYANGREIPLDYQTYQGLVSFRVPPARAQQPDTLRAQWHGQARYRNGLTDTLLEADVPYYIIKRR
jgi:hypothetical protein